jgi:hypothetical protein
MKRKKIYIENDGRILEVENVSQKEVQSLINWVCNGQKQDEKQIGFKDD